MCGHRREPIAGGIRATPGSGLGPTVPGARSARWSAPDAPRRTAALVSYQRVTVAWRSWVEAWENELAGKTHEPAFQICNPTCGALLQHDD